MRRVEARLRAAIGVPAVLTFRLEYMMDGIVMYSYMPDGDESRVGHVGMVVETGERIIKEVAPGDDCKSSAFMLLNRLSNYRKRGEFAESGMVAWC